MCHFLKTRFMNRKISRKISACMIFLVLSSSVLLAWSCSHAYSTQYIRQVDTQVSAMFDTASLTLRDNIYHLYRSVSAVASNPAIRTIYCRNRTGKKDAAFLEDLRALDTLFTTFLQNTSWAENIALLCPGGQVYSTYQNGWNYTADQFSEELEQTSITWLRPRESVFLISSSETIPICFPLRMVSSASFCVNQSPDMTLAVYLNLNTMRSVLEQFNTVADSDIYLADPLGRPITLEEDAPLFPSLTEEAFRTRIVQCGVYSCFNTRIDGADYRVSACPVDGSSLYLVHVFPYRAVHRAVADIYATAAVAAGLTMLAAVFLSLQLASTITVPIRSLLGQVGRIRAGDYDIRMVTRYDDELRQMDIALCDMAHMISNQIDAIQKTEELRRKIQLEAITDQMNPHFLYNTLDCIYWEVLNGHSKNAADMISSLAQFLRLTLNHGHEMMELPGVLQHTGEYVNIINLRFRSRVRFVYTIAPELETFLLPKSILQPLAENSILHGFGGEQGDPTVADPRISVICRQEGDRVLLLVRDNGMGFDPAAVERLLTLPSDHVGLYNVVQRLRFVFGDRFTVTASSIPYYQNEIRFEIRPPFPAPAQTE